MVLLDGLILTPGMGSMWPPSRHVAGYHALVGANISLKMFPKVLPGQGEAGEQGSGSKDLKHGIPKAWLFIAGCSLAARGQSGVECVL